MFRSNVDDATLHVFSDALEKAYACCAFLRCKEQGEVFVNLVTAKSRVMPMNRPTIPRAELLGAAIAARLHKSITESLSCLLGHFLDLVLGEDDENFQCPIVLPDHEITRRLIEYTHKILKHAGVQTLLGYLRNRFWIPRGRRITRLISSKCTPCKRHSSKHSTTECVPLPVDRIQRLAAFQVVGADLAGPVFLRGHQGTNFIGTSRALQNLDWEVIQADSTAYQIKWNFHPPSAPWYGGWWERLIRVLKDLLKRNLGKASLNYEEMLTMLAECESTINQRPLSHTSEDPEEPKSLTPYSHFLREVITPLHCDTVDLDLTDGNHLRKMLRYLQKARDDFPKRFQKEYLVALVKNPEEKQRYKLKEGDILLVGSSNFKRIDWPLARVEELISGEDGKHRVARLKLAHTTIIRPKQ
ncbi:uncharacterized protein [Parasteatoda tepidariorum]|uniref:uncharacterized protein n=1 Tax=Parasteatoda tepidariorum TaxID=114398 RepID=UPI0039BCE458